MLASIGDCVGVAQAIRGRFRAELTPEKTCETHVGILQGFHILFRMLGVQGLDKSDFSYN